MMKNQLVLKFKRNESFYIRDGWFEKAIHSIKENEGTNIFSKNNGVKYLGIGSNMVKSLRYWLEASGLIISTQTKVILSEFGELIYKYDPYLESDFVWFLIHYNLTINLENCPVNYAVFNSSIKSFTKQDLNTYIYDKLTGDGYQLKQDYIEDDLNVFLKSYTSDDINTNPEDNYVCPLSNLNLLKRRGRGYEKSSAPYSKLSPLVVYYCILKLFNGKPFNIEDSYNEEKAPCYLFNLDKNLYLQYLKAIQDMGLITINKTAGLNVVYFVKELSLDELFEREFDE